MFHTGRSFNQPIWDVYECFDWRIPPPLPSGFDQPIGQLPTANLFQPRHSTYGHIKDWKSRLRSFTPISSLGHLDTDVFKNTRWNVSAVTNMFYVIHVKFLQPTTFDWKFPTGHLHLP